MKFAFINNNYIEEQQAVIGINDLSIRRGYGIFDFFRTVGFKPFFMEKHLERFFTSSTKMGLPIPYSKVELSNICLTLINKNQLKDSGVRIILTGGYSPNSYTPDTPNLIITNEPLAMVDKKTRDRGIKVISHNFQREFAEIKTINYFTGIMIMEIAKEKGAFDVLYHDQGQIREFTRSNIFIIDDHGTIVTPDKKILKGVTRSNVIELAKKKFKVEERDFTMDELFSAREAFMTGTTKRILPIIQVDETLISDGKPGEVTMELFNDFYEMEKDYRSESLIS